MKYCDTCVLPDTRPNLSFDDQGLRCNVCASTPKQDIDWSIRARAFEELLEKVKSRGAKYDCIVPVSGGKDSTCVQLF